MHNRRKKRSQSWSWKQSNSILFSVSLSLSTSAVGSKRRMTISFCCFLCFYSLSVLLVFFLSFTHSRVVFLFRPSSSASAVVWQKKMREKEKKTAVFNVGLCILRRVLLTIFSCVFCVRQEWREKREKNGRERNKVERQRRRRRRRSNLHHLSCRCSFTFILFFVIIIFL